MLALRGSYGVGIEGGCRHCPDPSAARVRSQTLQNTIQSRCHARLVHLEWSVAPPNTVIYDRKSTFSVSGCLLVPPGLPGARLPPDCLQIASRLLPGCFQIASRLLPDYFQIASRLLSRLLPDYFQIADKLLPDNVHISFR